MTNKNKVALTIMDNLPENKWHKLSDYAFIFPELFKIIDENIRFPCYNVILSEDYQEFKKVRWYQKKTIDLYNSRKFAKFVE